MIEASRLKKLYGTTSDGVRAVDGVTFGVAPGELFVIMGLSGSGKSTLLRMLNRLVEPSSGTLHIDGRDVLGMGDADLRELRNHKINMVFQHFALFPHRTVRQNAAYGMRVRGVAEAERLERADWALKTVGLGDRGDAYPDQLSGGQRQRVGLARALATDAEILLMDEPFSALDPLIRRDMQDLLLNLQRDLRRTIIFVTHDLNEAMRLGDRIMVMRGGRVVQLGTASEILHTPSSDYVRDFVSDVDRSRVLTAREIMREPLMTARADDEPRDVLRRLSNVEAMRRLRTGLRWADHAAWCATICSPERPGRAVRLSASVWSRSTSAPAPTPCSWICARWSGGTPCHWPSPTTTAR